MKLLLVILIFVISLNADEMKRIESIVNDITKLRAENEGCKTESKVYAMQLKDEKDKNSILLQELDSFKNLYKREIEYKNQIAILKNKIKVQNNLLKVKENSKKDLIMATKPIVKIKDKTKETLVIKEKTIKKIVFINNEKANPFPKLVMKKEFLQDDKKLIKKEKIKELVKAKKIVKPKKRVEEKLENFKASTFRLNKDTAIYKRVNGKKLYEWEKGTSFTSSVKTQNWIKITGHFVDRAWRRSSKEMWVRVKDVIKR